MSERKESHRRVGATSDESAEKTMEPWRNRVSKGESKFLWTVKTL
jgi:hypothetical protein